MPQKLSEDDIIEILEAYDETGSKSKAAERVDRSRGTVRKYVDEYYEKWADENEKANVTAETGDEAGGHEGDQTSGDGGHVTDALAPDQDDPAPGPAPGGGADAPRADEDDEDSRDSGAPEGFTATPPSASPLNASQPQEEPRDGTYGDEDFASMGCGEFMEWFFQQPSQGVSEDFASNFAQLCRVRNQIPDREMMAEKIIEGASGIGTKSDAEMIAETYWVVAQDYLRAQGVPDHAQDKRGGWQSPEHQTEPQQPQQQSGWSRSEGEWMKANGQHAPTNGHAQGQDQAQGQPQQNADGEWVRPRDRQQGQNGQNGQAGQPQSPQYQPQPAAQPQRQPPAVMGSGTQQDESLEKLETVIKSMHEQLQQQQQTIQQMQGGNNPQQANQTLKEQMREFRQAKEELEAIADDGGDEAEQYVRALQRQVQNLEQQMQTQQASQGNNDMGWVVQLAQNDDMDPDTLVKFAEATGTTDPEVKKAEFELKKEERKAENRREMIDSIFENLGDVGEKVVQSGVASALGGGDGGDQEPAPGAGTQQPPQTQPAQTQSAEPSPNGQGGGGGTGMSGPAERFEQLQQETQDGDADMPDMEDLQESAEEALDEESDD